MRYAAKREPNHPQWVSPQLLPLPQFCPPAFRLLSKISEQKMVYVYM